MSCSQASCVDSDLIFNLHVVLLSNIKVTQLKQLVLPADHYGAHCGRHSLHVVQ
jgi:hypothetical protein